MAVRSLQSGWLLGTHSQKLWPAQLLMLSEGNAAAKPCLVRQQMKGTHVRK